MTDEKPRSSTAIVVIAIVAVVVAVIVGLLWLCGCLSGGKSPVRSRERTATILAVNDIYRIDGVGEGKKEGGLHRLRKKRQAIEEKSGKVLLLHAGDFLSPSLESRVFKGEQMIEAMNNLDGDPKKFDTRMFVAFGNHEFDDSDCNKSPAPLIARLNESQFTWLNVNLDFANCASMKDVMAHKNVKRTAIVELGGIKFGLFGIGLTPDPKDARKYPRFGDPYDAARAAIRELRAKKVDVVVALTHLEEKDDELLIRSLSGPVYDGDGLDLLIGGHDHSAMTIPDVSGTIRGFKADSDAVSAWTIKVVLPAKGRARFEIEKDQPEKLIGSATDDALDTIAKKWRAQAEAKFCAMRKRAERDNFGDQCLHKPAGTAKIPVSLEEANNRNSQTNFGQWIAGVVQRETDADVAIVNAGILGLNTNLQPNTGLLYEHVLDIFRYDDVIAVRDVPAKTVCEALRLGFSKPGTGAWPHVVGIKPDQPIDATEPKLDTPEAVKKTAKEIAEKWRGTLVLPKGASCDDEKSLLRVASVPYAMCGGDDYPFLAGGDEGASGSRSDKVTKCLDELTRNPIKGSTSAYISVMAEDAIVNDGIDLPVASRKRTRK